MVKIHQMSHELHFQTITQEPHSQVDPAAMLFEREMPTPWPTIAVGDGFRLYTAMADGQLVGAANVCGDLSEGMDYIRKIAIEPEHRNRGIGSALLRYTLDDMQQLGQTRAAICPSNDDNRRLYERLGFAKDPAERWTPSWLFLNLADIPKADC
jgi:GNAT superfamily N-acetyltransferase